MSLDYKAVNQKAADSFSQREVVAFPTMAPLRSWCVFFCGPLYALSSFLAIGPPAAPKLAGLGSANSLNVEDIEAAWSNTQLNSSSTWNSTSQINLSRFDNQTAEEAGSNDGSIAGGYFWLSDPAYDHQVNILTALYDTCLSSIDAVRWKGLQSLARRNKIRC
jgi:hypothetical protein